MAPGSSRTSTLGITLRALPTLLRVGMAETLAYRAEFLVWMLTTTQPIVMLALWTRVAAEGPFHGYSAPDFLAYFLAALIVRNLTGSWVVWQINDEIRRGVMAMRLLRPVHPFVAYAATHLSAVPLRAAVAMPVAIILIATAARGSVTHDPAHLALLLPSLFLAWVLTFSLLLAIGCLAFFIDKSMSVMDVYFGVFAVLSGYIIPLDLLPSWLAAISRWAPFRFMLSAPIEILLGREMSFGGALTLVGAQAAWALAMTGLAAAAWRAGVRRFEAVGELMAALRYGRLMAAQLRVSVVTAMQYRADFVLEGAMSVYWLGWNLLPLLILYRDRSAMAGWTFPEALIVISCFIILRGVLEGLISPSLVDVVERIRTGSFDYVLLKPADAQFLVSTARVAPFRIVDVLGGIGLLVYAIALRGQTPTALDAAAGATLLAAGALVMYALWILMVSAVFWAVRLDNLPYLLSAVFDTARWPVQVFPRIWRIIFTFVLPLALMTTYPAMAILGRIDGITAVGCLLGAAVLGVISRLVWRTALRNYTSASS